MKKINASDIQGYLVGIIIVSIVSAILIMFDDFAGYYHYDYYYHMSEYGYVYMGSGWFSTILLIIATLGLLTGFFYSSKILKSKDRSNKDIINSMKITKKGAILALAISVIGGAIFAISNIIDQTQEWWFDSGFYAGIIGSGLIIYFSKLVIDRVR